MPWTGTCAGLVSFAVLLRLRNLWDHLVSFYLVKNSTPLPDGELSHMAGKSHTLSEYEIIPSEQQKDVPFNRHEKRHKKPEKSKRFISDEQRLQN